MDISSVRLRVFEKKPKLAELVTKFGKMSLFEYTIQNFKSSQLIDKNREIELLEVFKEECCRLFGEDVAKKAVNQLENQWFVSTAEHHDPVCHAFDLSGTLIRSYVNQKLNFENIIVFSCSSISLNNSSFPRGIFWHSKDLDEQRVHLLPWRLRNLSVCAAPNYQLENISKQKNSDKDNSEKINKIIEEVYLEDQVVNAENFSDQISLSNLLLWKKLPGQVNKNLLYVSQEKIVSKLILNYHLQRNTQINNLLFNSKWRDAYLRIFDSIPGAFNSEFHTGSHLFWGINNGKRVKLSLVGDCLVSDGGSVSIKLTQSEVETALRQGIIIPTMALTFITLAFYYGLTCGGGFSQVDYLPKLEEAWRKLLEQSLDSENVYSPITNFLSADYSFVSLQNIQRKSVLSTVIDLILYQEQNTAGLLENLSKSYTIEAALDNLMPEFYSIVGNKSIKNEPVLTRTMPVSIYAK